MIAYIIVSAIFVSTTPLLCMLWYYVHMASDIIVVDSVKYLLRNIKFNSQTVHESRIHGAIESSATPFNLYIIDADYYTLPKYHSTQKTYCIPYMLMQSLWLILSIILIVERFYNNAYIGAIILICISIICIISSFIFYLTVCSEYYNIYNIERQAVSNSNCSDNSQIYTINIDGTEYIYTTAHFKPSSTPAELCKQARRRFLSTNLTLHIFSSFIYIISVIIISIVR